jgi:hypothetical protein
MRFPHTRVIALGAFFAFSAAIFALPQRNSPAGNRWPDSAGNGGFHVEPPQGQGAKSIDSAKLRADSAELLNLTAAVRTQVDQVSKGMIPKDMDGNLKRIEKLAKRLRNEINP